MTGASRKSPSCWPRSAPYRHKPIAAYLNSPGPDVYSKSAAAGGLAEIGQAVSPISGIGIVGILTDAWRGTPCKIRS